jgi:hypothetical protein
VSTLLTKSRLVVLLAVSTAAAFAGCGGGGGPSNDDVAAISKCLEGKKGEYRVLPGKGIESRVIPDASKSLVVRYNSGNDAIVVAESSGDKADAVERNFRTEEANASKIERKGNVVIGWTRDPVGAESDAMGECV